MAHQAIQMFFSVALVVVFHAQSVQWQQKVTSGRKVSMQRRSNLTPARSQTPTLAFCDLVSSPSDYDKKTVRVKAILIENHVPRVDGNESFLYDPTCYSEDTATLAETDPAYNVSPQTEQALRRIRSQQDERGYSRAEAVIIGRFDAPNGRGYGHLDRFRSRFIIMQVEQVKPVAANTPWPWEIRRDAPISRAERGLKALSNELMMYYARARSDASALDGILADGFTFTDANGRAINKAQFIEEIGNAHFMGTVSNEDIEVYVLEDKATVTGLITKSTGREINEQYRYYNKFIKRQGRWQAISLKMIADTQPR